ncbi:membrane protein [Undibacterium sp. KW1]|uniref:YjgN family protein n=1 Tax=Undibacterium sp. KW1 TaxID=2058624 RepID=UPI001331CE39|nr:YjgN family protein [Undibacterium sp. KW1]BBB62815.1 membrane protein [Undibacterium sp. KW1]
MQIHQDAEVWLPTVPLVEYQEWTNENIDALDIDPSPATTAAAIASKTGQPRMPDWYQLSFSGTGKEYFRIWVVNLCLSLATLGIYSAWAKVRRLEYFDRNTSLAGASFNFHGEAKTILRGRIVAVVLLFCYHYLFTLSKNLALLFFVIFVLGLPFMMRSALRFRLHQTSYRGLRFQFHGSVQDAYAAYAPVALVILLPGLFGALFPEESYMAFFAFLGYIFWPWLHARMRIYQHDNISYGNLRASCDMKSGAFSWSYVGVLLALFCSLIVGIFLSGIVAVIIEKNGGSLLQYIRSTKDVFFMVIGFLMLLAAVLAAIGCLSYIQAVAWNKSWDNTSFPGIDIDSSLPYWPYWRLQVKNFFFTLFSLGLYRPFAVVAVYRFRLAYVRLLAEELDQVQAISRAGQTQATGDSSADMFGFDLSW